MINRLKGYAVTAFVFSAIFFGEGLVDMTLTAAEVEVGEAEDYTAAEEVPNTKQERLIEHAYSDTDYIRAEFLDIRSDSFQLEADEGRDFAENRVERKGTAYDRIRTSETRHDKGGYIPDRRDGGGYTKDDGGYAEVPQKQSLGEFTVTAYCLCVVCCGIWSAEHPTRIDTGFVQRTASGTIPTAGRTIAVDTQLIPHGTAVIISGHTFIAEDTGSGVNGLHIDILKDCHQEALEFGRQRKEVFVYAQ